MRKLLYLLIGLICGAMVGAVAGVLLAPYAGDELRNRISEWAAGLVEKGQQAAAIKRAELEAQLEAFKHGQPVVLQEAGDTSKG